MSETEIIPDRLKNREGSEPQEVIVPIEAVASRDYNPEHVARLKADLGTVLIDPKRLKAIAELGMEAKALGVLHTIHGSMLVTRDALLRTIEFLSTIVNDETGKYKDKTKMQASKDIGYISEKLTKLNLGEIKVEQTVAEVQITADKTRRQSFKPMERIVVNVSSS